MAKWGTAGRERKMVRTEKNRERGGNGKPCERSGEMQNGKTPETSKIAFWLQTERTRRGKGFQTGQRERSISSKRP